MNQSLFPSLIQSILQNQFELLNSKEIKLNLIEITFYAFREDLEKINNGYLIRSYGKTESPKLISILGDEKIVPKNLRNLVGSLEIFTFWEETFNLELLWKKMGQYVPKLFQFTDIQNITPNLKDDLCFHLSEFKIFKIEGLPSILYLAIDSEHYDSVTSSIQDTAEIQKFTDLIRVELKKQDSTNKINPKLLIEKQKELLIGEYLIPRTFLWGNIPVRARILSLRETQSKDAGVLSFWFGLSLTYDKSYYLQYGFPHQKMEHPEAIKTKYQSLFGTIIRNVVSTKWNQLSKKLEKSGSKFLEKPLFPLFEKGVLVEYEIQLNQTFIPAQIIVPKSLIDFLIHMDSKNESLEATEPVFHFLNLNKRFISEYYSNTHRLYFHKLTNRNYPILLFEFIQIISETELRLTIQNYFVASGIKTLDLQKLFFYLSMNPETNEKSLYLDDQFDEKKIKSMLPPGMQKEWESFPVNPENRSGLASIAYNEDEFVLKNKAVMQDLYLATKNGKIEFSSRAEYVLYLEFENLLQEELNSQIKQIHADHLNLFSKLKNVPKANLQQFFYSHTSNEFGSIFLAWEAELVKIQPYVSKQFYQEVIQEGKSRQQQYENGSLDLKIVVDLKEKFVSELNVLTSEEFV